MVCRRWQFFLFFSLSYPKRYTLALFVFGILIPVIFLLIFYFCPWPFYKSFICFQFNPSITIFHIHLSHLYFWCFNSSLFFIFDFVFLGFFIKILFFFNLILKWQFFLCYFLKKFNSYSLDFYFFFLGLFVKILLIFNFIIQSNFMVYYFFQFDSYSFDLFSFLLK